MYLNLEISVITVEFRLLSELYIHIYTTYWYNKHYIFTKLLILQELFTIIYWILHILNKIKEKVLL